MAANFVKCIKEDYLPNVGIHKLIYSDNGSQFTSALWKDTLQGLGIEARRISLYHACSNPVKRYFRQVKQFLQAYCHDNQNTWVNYLQGAEDQINFTHNETTKEIPFKAMYGRPENAEIRKIIKFPYQQTTKNLENIH